MKLLFKFILSFIIGFLSSTIYWFHKPITVNNAALYETLDKLGLGIDTTIGSSDTVYKCFPKKEFDKRK